MTCHKEKHCHGVLASNLNYWEASNCKLSCEQMMLNENAYSAISIDVNE